MSASDSVTPGLYSEALLRSSRLLRTERSYALRRVLVACERIGDFTSAAFGTAVALSLNAPSLHLLHEITAISIVCGLIAVLDLQANHAYDGGGSLLQIRETERIVRASVHSVLLLIPLSLIMTSVISKSAVVIAPMTIAISLMVQKRCFFLMLRHLDRYQNGGNRIVIYGAGSADRRIVSALLRSIRLGFLPVAIIDDSPEAMDRQVVELGYRWRSSIAVHAAPISPEFLASCECDTLVVIANRLTSAQTAIAAKCARLAGAQVAFASDPDVHDSPWTNLKDMDGTWMSFADKSHNPSVLYELSKRILDIALSSIALIAACPLFLLAAILIRLDSPGPVLFVQDRVGLNGRIFRIYKFRSMYSESAKYERSPTTPMDPRLTRIGRLLRRLSIDELPQLINVMLGNMSLVGPRPEMSFIVEGYDAHQRKRLRVTPGITGLWQLSGDRGFPIHENLDYDLYYVEHRGLFMDVAILIHTVLFAMRGGI